MLFLTTHLWLSAIILIGATTLISMAGPVMIRRQVPLARLNANNEIAGFKFAVIGVLYAVQLAFAVIVVWEKWADAEKYAAQEAGAAATLYRLSAGLGVESGAALRDTTTHYVKTAIAEDWPAMERGEANRAVTHALDDMYARVLDFHPGDTHDAAVLAEVLQQLDFLTQARRARLVMASGIVPDIIWFGLFGGAVVTIGFTFFFGAENLRAQAVMTGILSFLIFSALLIIIAIDYPFAGSVKVGPEALSLVLRENFGVASPQ